MGITLDESKIKKARTLERYVSAKLENTYILFLEPLVGFPDLKDYYTGAIHPWRFDLSDPEQVIPESPWDGALGAFPATKMSIFLDKIANPDQDEGYPYPAPPEKP